MSFDVAATGEAVFRERIRAAGALTATDKLLAGPRLFERACSLAAAGLRHRHPEADDTAIRALIDRQLATLRRLEAGR